MMFCENKKRIVVAMSGGVDSSTVATMLHHQGHQVIGVTLQLYDQGLAAGKKGACCAGQDIYDASQVAAKLGIAHYVLDYETKFKQTVIDNFVESYVNGETPLPCVRCNQSVKFNDLLEFARELKADCLATGHYVRKVVGAKGAELHRGVDLNKDQSYFLFATTKEQLDYLYFPLGELTKDKTRDLARKSNLPIAEKPDSQDICFVPDGDYRGLIAKLRPNACESGDIVHVDGYVVGQHKGIINYTIGQRRGLNISGDHPLYVVKLDPVNNIVFVGPKEALATTEFLIKKVNWLGEEYIEGAYVQVKVRSTRPSAFAYINKVEQQMLKVTLLAPEYGVAPGQACVIYDNDRVLGGGWIV